MGSQQDLHSFELDEDHQKLKGNFKKLYLYVITSNQEEYCHTRPYFGISA
jgi:hypothetical protein